MSSVLRDASSMYMRNCQWIRIIIEPALRKLINILTVKIH